MECIPFWNLCNNRCLMCSNPPDYASFGDYSLKALKAAAAGFSRSEREIYLTGGEPTLNPAFFEFLSFLRGRFPAARLLVDTNGRMLSYPDFAARCAGIGNIEFQVSLCGPDARSHDAVTLAPGSFAQATAGIRNLLRLKRSGVSTEIRFVLSRLSLGGLGGVYRLVKKEFPGVSALVLIFLEMEGHAGRNSRTVGLRYAEAAGPVARLLDGARGGPELRLYHFPLCTLPPRLWRRAWRTLPEKEIAFPAGCRRCAVKAHCLGVHRDYLELYGASEFRPVAAAPRLVLTGDPCRPIRSAAAR